MLIVENVFAENSYRHTLGARGYRLWRHVAPNDVYIPAGIPCKHVRSPLDFHSSAKEYVARLTGRHVCVDWPTRAGTPRRVEDADLRADSAWLPPFGDEPIVSYSQNAEDVRLWRVFRNIENGVSTSTSGRRTPGFDSVTHLFYEHGWSGINVEPSPCFDALESARPRDVNLDVAVGDGEGPVSFFLTQPYLGLSTFDPRVHARVAGVVKQIQEVEVTQRRLASILEEHAADRTIHFLKVDVKGAEPQALASSDWARFRPVVVVVESIASSSAKSTDERWGEHPPGCRAVIDPRRSTASIASTSTGPTRT